MCMYNTSNVLSIFFTVCYTAFGEGLSKRRDTYYFCSVHAKKYSFCSSFSHLAFSSGYAQ